MFESRLTIETRFKYSGRNVFGGRLFSGPRLLPHEGGVKTGLPLGGKGKRGVVFEYKDTEGGGFFSQGSALK